MKTFRIILGIVLVIFSFSCKKEKKTDLQVEEYLLTDFMEVNLTDEGLLNPDFTEMSDSLLVIVEDGIDDLVQIYNCEGKLLSKFGRLGQGPNEFLQLLSIDIFPSDDNLYLGFYDGNKKSYYTSVIDGDDKEFQMNVLWSNPVNLNAVKRIDNERFIGTAVYDTNTYYLIGANGEILNAIEAFPPKPESVSVLSHSMACTGVLATSAKYPYFARSVTYDGGIDFLKVSDDNVVEPRWRHTFFNMDYDVLPDYHNVPRPNDNSKYGYISLSFSDNHLYGLFSGKRMLQEDSFSSSEIHVFDFQGNLLKKYILNTPVFEIKVTSDDNKIYGLSWDKEDVKLLTYSL